MPVSASILPDSSLSGQVFQEVNAFRRSNGVSQLQRHGGLDRLAQQHSEYLRQHRGTFGIHGKNVSHIGFDGRALAAKTRFQMENISENVAATGGGSGSAKAVFNLWKTSKTHHTNMISRWTHSGIGVVVDDDGMVFATQLFATVSNSQISSRERFNRF